MSDPEKTEVSSKMLMKTEKDKSMAIREMLTKTSKPFLTFRGVMLDIINIIF